MAAFLAVATFLSNEAVKHVITGETHRAEASARLETNPIRIDVAEGDARRVRGVGAGGPPGTSGVGRRGAEGAATMLRVLGAGGPREHHAAVAASAHEARIVEELQPADARLAAQDEHHTHHTHPPPSQHTP